MWEKYAINFFNENYSVFIKYLIARITLSSNIQERSDQIAFSSRPCGKAHKSYKNKQVILHKLLLIKNICKFLN